MGTIKDVVLTPLKILENPSGSILHAMKKSEENFAGFGEAYFSTVNFETVKGWKKHNRMVLNLIVPEGKILFVLFDGRQSSETRGNIQEVILSRQNYQRLTVPPGIWMSFKGLCDGINMLLNIASIPHDPTESDSLPLINDLILYKPFLL